MKKVYYFISYRELILARYLLLGIIFILSTNLSYSQFVFNGYFYFSLPEANILGKGWGNSKFKVDPIESGNPFKYPSDALEITNSASSKLDSINQHIKH